MNNNNARPLIFYPDWEEAIQALPEQYQLGAYQAVIRYAFYGEMPEDPIINACTLLMRTAIDRERTKQTTTSELRAEAGRKGAAIANEKRQKSAKVGKNDFAENEKRQKSANCNTKSKYQDYNQDYNQDQDGKEKLKKENGKQIFVDDEKEIIAYEDAQQILAQVEVNNSLAFDHVWDLYDKKRGNKTKLRKQWNALPLGDRQAALEHIPRYVAATPDKQFRKDFQTYLNQEAWNDEIIITTSHGNSTHLASAQASNPEEQFADRMQQAFDTMPDD